MWTQIPDPFANIFLSAGAALIPILVLFVLLLSRMVSGYIACILTLVLGLLIAVGVFHFPVVLASMTALYGILSGLFPIGWIVLNAVFLYNISIKTGSFVIVRKSIEAVTPDRRLQALLIAFCFGAFLEGSAGFGAPVAITAGMLVGLGFQPLYAAGICLISNTAPVAFGGIGIAVITAGQLTSIDPAVLSKMIAHQLPFIALLIPLWLVVLMSGWKNAKEVWPALIVSGVSYATTMFLVASFLGPMLPDVLSAVVSIVCLVGLLKVWRPKHIWRFPNEQALETTHHTYTFSTLLKAWTPFILLIIFVGNWGTPRIQSILDTISITIPFGVLNHAIIANGKQISVIYHFSWLSAAGSAILLAAIITAVLFRVSLKLFITTYKETVVELAKPLITIGAIVGFAYVANYSGMTTAIGNVLKVSGPFFPLLSPILGWLGVFITGSDTSSNALFSTVQQQTAESLDINPVLSVAANTSGGVAAKMISPQSIAVAAAATKLTAQEGTLFRFTLPHSIGFIAIISAITFIQARYLTWMIPEQSSVSGYIDNLSLGSGEILLVMLSLGAIITLTVFNLRKKL